MGMLSACSLRGHAAVGPGTSREWGPHEDRKRLSRGPGRVDLGGSPRVPRTQPTEGVGLRGRTIRDPLHLKQPRSSSPGPGTQQPVRNKAGLAWRCLRPSSARQDTQTDTQPGSGRGTAPAHPVPEKQTQHRVAVPRPHRAGSAQQ